MLGNWVNAADFQRAALKLRAGEVGNVARRMAMRPQRRVETTWAHVESPPTHPWDIPAVRRRTRLLASGDEDREHYEYLAERYLTEGGLHAVSLGCGAGQRELRWARTGRFARLDCYDISAPRISAARRQAEAAGYGHILNFEVRDALDLVIPPGSLDVVIGEHALHHIKGLDALFPRVATWLKPTGCFFVNEFVGPTRFQYTDRQLEAATALLRLLPRSHRVELLSGRVKNRITRPSKLRMLLEDPSEAVESSLIVPLLEKHFRILERRPLGGTLLNLVVNNIAHHFIDSASEELLDACFAVEDALLASGDITSDHMVMVAAPFGDAAPTSRREEGDRRGNSSADSQPDPCVSN